MDPDRERDIATETLLLLGNFREVYVNYCKQFPRPLFVADRFFTSTLGYQGSMSESAKQLVRRIVDLAFPEPVIDVRLVLDVPYEIGQARIASRKLKDRFDLADRESFEKVRAEIMVSASHDLPHAVVLDNSGTFERTMIAAWEAVSGNPCYPGKRKC
jgi:dTMP kinase